MGGVRFAPPHVASQHASELPICFSGVAVPRVYLLGIPKSGTTSMAVELMDAGFEKLGKGEKCDESNLTCKESDVFKKLCGFVPGIYDYTLPGCPAASPEVKQRWLDTVSKISNKSCSAPQGTIMDATPTDARQPGLPTLLSGLYGSESHRLGFLIVYREPLERMQSHWYFFRGQVAHQGAFFLADFALHNGLNFMDYLTSRGPLVKWYKERDYEGMDVELKLDWVYESMYSLSVPQWLKTFRDQLVVIPMGKYFGSTTQRDALIATLALKFGATLSSADLGEQRPHSLKDERPPLSEDVDNATAAYWYDEYLRPNLRSFAGLLADALPSGLDVLGYTGGANESEMFNYLCATMPCLL